jgi:hypothetical protein
MASNGSCFGYGPAHVILAAPHALVDGRCLLRLLHELLVACAALHRGEPLDAGGGTGSLLAVSNVGRYPYSKAYAPFELTGLWGLNGASLLGPALLARPYGPDGH